MEQRSITKSKVYFLALNSIHANAEQGNVLLAASSEQALRDFYEAEKLRNQQVINGMRYAFKEGPLRNYNPLHEWHHISENLAGWNQGWFYDWMEDVSDIRHDIVRVDF